MDTSSSSPTSATDNRVAAGSDIPRPSDGRQAVAPGALNRQDDTGPRDADDELPFPPRYRWLKRIMLAAVLSILFLLAIRLAWGWHAHRAFERAIAEIRQRGEPIEPEDFDGPEVPDEENAALAYQKINNTWPLTQEEQKFIEVALEPEHVEGRSLGFTPDMGQRLMERNREYLAIVRSLRSKSRSAVPAWSSPVMLSARGTEKQHRVSKLLCALANDCTAREDYDTAIQYMLDAIAYAEHLQADTDAIGCLKSFAQLSLAYASVEQFLLHVKCIENSDLHSDARRSCASRRDVLELLNRLTDEPRFSEMARHALLVERMKAADTAKSLFEGRLTWSYASGFPSLDFPTWTWRFVNWPASPRSLSDGICVLVDYRYVLDAMSQLNWPAASATMSNQFVMENRNPSPMRFPIRAAVWVPDRLFALIQYRAFCDRRMTATAVAIRLFEEDHARRPAVLEKLVPGYLTAVPLDPFAANGHPIRYAPDGEEPILYSVGYDGDDDGGRIVYQGTRINRYEGDLPYYLDGRPADDEATTGPTSSKDSAENGQTPGEPAKAPLPATTRLK